VLSAIGRKENWLLCIYDFLGNSGCCGNSCLACTLCVGNQVGYQTGVFGTQVKEGKREAGRGSSFTPIFAIHFVFHSPWNLKLVIPSQIN
jgi:hypothetical protein